MKSSAVAVLSVLLVGLPNSSILAIDGKHVNGISVYTRWRLPFDVDNPYTAKIPRGPIVLAAITNNKVVARDTIYRGIAQYPTFNSNATKVAIWRWGVQVTYDANNTWHPVAGSANNPSYLAVINLADKTVSNLIQVAMNPTNANGEGNEVMDWPAGDWIYYHKPEQTGDIYKINVNDPTQNILVMHRNLAAGEEWRRFSLTLDGKIAGSQGGVGNCTYPFPYDGRSFCAPGCNVVVSAGGGWMAHFFGGCHDDIDICKNNRNGNWTTPNPWVIDRQVTIATIEKWLGNIQISYNKCSDLNRWSVNSEKWALRQIGWCGQAMDIGKGCSQVMVNWVDSAAIVGNELVPPPKDCWNPPTPLNQWTNACPGDFYITGDATHPNSVVPNTWEDTAGVWHAVQTTAVSGDEKIRQAVSMSAIDFRPREMRIVLDMPVQFQAALIDLSGKIITQTSGIGETRLPLTSRAAGTRFVRICAANQVMVKPVSLIR